MLTTIQSPPQEKGTRVVPPWAKYYDTPVVEMKLPLHLTSTLTDDTRVRNYIMTKPGGVKETTLHLNFFTTKLIPKLDKFIDTKNMGKMREIQQKY